MPLDSYEGIPQILDIDERAKKRSMANPKHIKWLLEGVKAWNKRREQEDFVPDFEGTNIYEEFRNSGKLDKDGYIPLVGINLRKANCHKSCFSTPYKTVGADLRNANLWSANLQHTQLANSKFDGANLAGTRFNNARLSGSSLRVKSMASTTFSKADLSQANLKGARFANACLANANLCCSTLEGADLTAADLTGADLGWSRPWKAKLFKDGPPSTRAYKHTSYNKRINCVADLIKVCTDLGAQHTDYLLYFRGEPANIWELRPSVMRRSQNNKFILRTKESNMLLDLMSRRPEDFSDTTSALSQWVLAQHHGLSTTGSKPGSLTSHETLWWLYSMLANLMKNLVACTYSQFRKNSSSLSTATPSAS